MLPGGHLQQKFPGFFREYKHGRSGDDQAATSSRSSWPSREPPSAVIEKPGPIRKSPCQATKGFDNGLSRLSRSIAIYRISCIPIVKRTKAVDRNGAATISTPGSVACAPARRDDICSFRSNISTPQGQLNSEIAGMSGTESGFRSPSPAAFPCWPPLLPA